MILTLSCPDPKFLAIMDVDTWVVIQLQDGESFEVLLKTLSEKEAQEFLVNDQNGFMYLLPPSNFIDEFILIMCAENLKYDLEIKNEHPF